MLRDRLVYNINVSEQFDEYDLKEVFQFEKAIKYSGSVVKTKIQAFYNELIYVTR